jgi:hypothetical protein
MNISIRTIVSAIALSLGMSSAYANKLIPAESMTSSITEEMVKLIKTTNPDFNSALHEVRVLRYRVASAKIKNKQPTLGDYHDFDNATPYINCNPDNASSDTLTLETSHAQESSFSKVQSATAGVSLEVSGQIAGVGTSLAASFEMTFETGETHTTSKQETKSVSKNVTVSPLSGTWIVPAGERFEYENAPYEVEVEVVEAQMGIKLPTGIVWMPITLKSPYPRFTVTGQVTAKLPKGAMGLKEFPMPKAEVKEKCEKGFDDLVTEHYLGGSAGMRAGTNAKLGTQAGRKYFSGVVPPEKRKLLKLPVLPKR